MQRRILWVIIKEREKKEPEKHNSSLQQLHQHGQEQTIRQTFSEVRKDETTGLEAGLSIQVKVVSLLKVCVK